MSNNFLLNDFYKIEEINSSDSKITAKLSLNPDHAIFKGHFEQMPVVPGVCQTQILKELLQNNTGKTLLLSKGDNIKFMGMIVPTQNPVVMVEMDYVMVESNVIKADAKLFFENTTFTKFKGEFEIN